LLSTSETNAGLYGISNDNVAGVVGQNQSESVASLQGQKNVANTHAIFSNLDLYRTTSGTAINGIGQSIRFITETSTGAQDTTNSIESFWSTVTHASRESQMNIRGVDNTSNEVFMNIQKDLVRINNNADTLATKAYARSVGGSAPPSLHKGLTLEFPGSAESFGVWKTPVDITISSVEAVLVGSSSPSVTFNIAFGSDRTSGTNVYSSGRTVTSTTTGSTFNSSFNDQTIPAGSFIWFTTTAQSGTVTQIEITINYTED
jgi:hypothetical protein